MTRNLIDPRLVVNAAGTPEPYAVVALVDTRSGFPAAVYPDDTTGQLASYQVKLDATGNLLTQGGGQYRCDTLGPLRAQIGAGPTALVPVTPSTQAYGVNGVAPDPVTGQISVNIGGTGYATSSQMSALQGQVTTLAAQNAALQKQVNGLLGVVDTAPTAALAVTVSGATVTADPTGSHAGSSAVGSYVFQWGDGAVSSSPIGTPQVHTYGVSYSGPVVLTLTDAGGLSGVASASAAVTVTAGPPSAAVPMPTGDLAGWRYLRGDDFLGTATAAQFPSQYGYLVPSGIDPAGNGKLDPSSVSAHDGMLDLWAHHDATGAVLDGGVLFPISGAPGAWGYDQVGGRYSVRFKVDDPTVVGYRAQFVLWPQSNVYADGETDFPQGNTNGPIGWASHESQNPLGKNDLGTTVNPANNASGSTTGAFDVWHIATIEWTPAVYSGTARLATGLVSFYLDGVLVGSDTSDIPYKARHWALQVETQLTGGAPIPAAAVHVLVDWAAAWAYAPATVPTAVPGAPLLATPNVATPNSVTLSWTDSTNIGNTALTNTNVYIDGLRVASTVVSPTVYTTPLTAGTHTASVSVMNAVGESPRSNTQTFVVAAPAAPASTFGQATFDQSTYQ